MILALWLALTGGGLPATLPHAALVASVPGAEATTLPALPPALVGWLLYATTAGMVGLAAFRWGILEPLRSERSFALVAFPALRRA